MEEALVTCPVCCHPMRVSVVAEDGALVSCEAERS